MGKVVEGIMNIKQDAYIIDSTSVNEQKKTAPHNERLSLKLRSINSDICVATVVVPSPIVQEFYDLAAQHQQKSLTIPGFEKGQVPLGYIKKNYRENLIIHTQELLFKFYAISFLYQEIREQQLIVAGEPRLVEIALLPESEASFSFELTLITDQLIQEWKYFPFNAPKRKRYKDLDKQVKTFIDTEKEAELNHAHDSIQFNDWIYFSIIIVDTNKQALAHHLPQYFWFHLGKEDTESTLRNVFLERHVGDSYITENSALQEYFSTQLDSHYLFNISILNKVPATYIDFESAKRHFKLKTNKTLHQKLIEVFSYRNDLSQRRAIAQEALATLLDKHPVKPPLQMVLRKQEDIIKAIKESADYNVYRIQKSFEGYLLSLAEKQCSEEIIIDHIAAHENISITHTDVYDYLNLYKRARTKEFIYFKIPAFTLQNQEIPASCEEIMRYCLREKTLNYIIYHLTKD